MKKFFLIALIALLYSVGFARGTWSIMNADPNGIFGFEDNMNSSFMKAKMPAHLRAQAIEKWQNVVTKYMFMQGQIILIKT